MALTCRICEINVRPGSPIAEWGGANSGSGWISAGTQESISDSIASGYAVGVLIKVVTILKMIPPQLESDVPTVIWIEPKYVLSDFLRSRGAPRVIGITCGMSVFLPRHDLIVV